MARLPRAGVSAFTVDGIPYDIADAVSWTPNALVKSTLVGMTGVHGFSAEPQQGKISTTIRDDSGISSTDFLNMTDVVVVVNTRSGKQVIGNSMWVTGAVATDLAAGTFAVEFEGPDVTERVI
jgi:hypothetical protein